MKVSVQFNQTHMYAYICVYMYKYMHMYVHDSVEGSRFIIVAVTYP